MQQKVTIQNNGQYLQVEVRSGGWTLMEIFKMISLVRIQTLLHNQNKVLVDISVIPPVKRDFDRYLAGERVAKIFASTKIKIAVIARREAINGFFENAAVNRGALVKVFSSKEAAVQWLSPQTAVVPAETESLPVNV